MTTNDGIDWGEFGPKPNPDDHPDPDRFSTHRVGGRPGVNPALDHLMQLLDVGNIVIKRGPAKQHDGEGGLLEVPGVQCVSVEIVRRTDGEVFSSAIMLPATEPPAAWIVSMAHLLQQGVERLRRG